MTMMLMNKAVGRGDPEVGSAWCFVNNSWVNFSGIPVSITISDLILLLNSFKKDYYFQITK